MAVHETLTQGLVGYWPMTEAGPGARVDITGLTGNFIDVLSNTGSTQFNPSFNPTIQLGVAARIFEAGPNALSCSGSTEGRSNAHLATSDNRRQLTFCSWGRLDAYPTGGETRAAFLAKLSFLTNSCDYGLEYDINQGFVARVGSGSGIRANCYNTRYLGPTRPALGTWWFLVGRWTPGGTLELILNNSESSTVPTPTLPNAASIARLSPSSAVSSDGITYNDTLTGGVCNIGLWSRLLTDAEIGDLWQGGYGSNYDFSYPTP